MIPSAETGLPVSRPPTLVGVPRIPSSVDDVVKHPNPPCGADVVEGSASP